MRNSGLILYIFCRSGGLYDPSFLLLMAEEDRRLVLSNRLQNLMELLYSESLCLNCAPQLNIFKDRRKSNQQTVAITDKSLGHDAAVTDCDKNQTNCESKDHEPKSKKIKLTESSSKNEEVIPMFYYDVHRRKFKNVNQLPK